jgi:hypothetical protein
MSGALAVAGVVGVLGLMGAMRDPPKQTQTYKSDFQHLTNITNDIISRTVATTDTTVSSTGEITVENSKFLGCIFSVEQTIDSKVNVIQTIESNSRVDILANLSAEITANIIQQSENKDSMFKEAIKGWLGSSPDTEKSVDLNAAINTILKNSITDEVFSNIFNDVNNKLTSTTSNVTVDTCPTELIDKICGGGKCTPQEAANMYEVMCKDRDLDGVYRFPKCPIKQSIYSNVVAQNLVIKVLDALVNSTINTSMATQLEQTDRTSDGLEWWVWLVIAGAALVFLFIFFMIMRSRGGGGGGGNRSNFYRIPDNE